MTASQRYFIVGTDTDVGKTRVTAALVRAVNDLELRTVAYKPAISGPAHAHDDLELLRAAMQPPAPRADIHCFAYAAPLAPGIAQNPTPFFATATAQQDPPELRAALTQLGKLELEYDAQVTFIEGAGGLCVPMPGGSWLEDWIVSMAARVIIVGRLGLGTLNHTLLTYEALKRRGLAVHAFVLSQTQAPSLELDPSTEHNLDILRAQLRVPCLGVLPHHGLDSPPPHTWLEHHTRDDWIPADDPRP